MGLLSNDLNLRIELNMGYSRHHLMVPVHFYCWVAGSFNKRIVPNKARPGIRPGSQTNFVVAKLYVCFTQ